MMAADPRSDAQLLADARRDPEAFGVLYDRHAVAVLGFFARRTACPATAADLAAETFAQAYASRRRYRDTGDPATAWLFTIARRQLAGYLRRQAVDDRARRRLDLAPAALDERSYERIEELADLRALRGALEAALASLPAEQAAAIRLRVLQELSYADVAGRLGCSEGAARVRVCRGLDRLARLLPHPRQETTT
jgi:RNA polymerase sigma-70 factor (ECF subfamily)